MNGHDTQCKSCSGCDRDKIPDSKLLHPQFVPRRNQIKTIIKQAAGRPKRRQKLNREYYLKYIVAISVLWFINDSNVRFYYGTGDLNMLLLYHGLQLLSLIIYYMLTNSDPGYLPINQECKDGVFVEMNGDENKSLVSQKKVVDLSAATLPPNFCERCKFFKPPRAKHCYLCDRCVAKFDHHCPFIDHCVGLNNYRLFMSYLCVQGLVSLWTFVVAINCLFLQTSENYIQLGLKIGLFLAMLYQSVIALIMILFHIYSISANVTTHEHGAVVLKNKHKLMSTPDRRCCLAKQMESLTYFLCCKGQTEYSHGCIKNWVHFIIGTGVDSKWSQPNCPSVIGEY